MSRHRGHALSKAAAALRSRRASGRERRKGHESPLDNGWFDLTAALCPDAVWRFRDVELVLQALRIPYSRHPTPGGVRVMVPPDHAEHAQAEVSAFLDEGCHLTRRIRTHVANRWSVVTTLSALLAFFAFTRWPWPWLGLYPHTWSDLGAADAGRMLSGEWWRALTALTLHGDGAHVLGNVVVGSIFISPLAARAGLGTAWLCVLMAGGLGNCVNALVQGAEHVSIGFSTSVFGAAGMAAALRARLDRSQPGWTFVAAGLALLALLGVGDERTDVGAHLFGFAAGLGLGAVLGGRILRRGRVGPTVDKALYAGAWGMVLAAWSMAFG